MPSSFPLVRKIRCPQTPCNASRAAAQLGCCIMYVMHLGRTMHLYTPCKASIAVLLRPGGCHEVKPYHAVISGLPPCECHPLFLAAALHCRCSLPYLH